MPGLTAAVQDPTPPPILSPVPSPVPSPARLPALRAVHSSPDAHTWQLRGVDFEDGETLRRFECVGCDAVRFD